jgi:outer membrane protein assembly factor BamB
MRTRRGWGEGVSPTLHDAALLVNWDHEGDSFLVALDAGTGETRWKVDRDEPTSWSTPFVIDRSGHTQVVVNATNRVRSYDFDTGDLLWECGGQNTNVISSPVAIDDTVFCMSSYGESTVHAIPLSARGDITDSERLTWRYDRLAPYCPSPLLYDNHLYFTRGNSTLLTSLDARTGETVLPPTRLPLSGSMYASPVGAAGRVYVVDRDGTTVVLRHGDKFEVLATNRLDDPMDASPAIVGRQILLRGRRFLYCLEE